MRHLPILTSLASVFAVSACAVAPSAPTVMALPPQGKPFSEFQGEDAYCRSFANQQIGGGQAVQQSANNAGVGTAVAGTALGAGLGAAIGAASGAAGPGAAIGAAAGLLTGTAWGANNAQAVGYGAQSQYDTAYTQCMYAYGNSIQSAPGAVAVGSPYGGYPAYGYGPPIVAGPTVVVGGGWGGGWGWRGGGWRGPGWRGPGWYR